MRRLSFAGPMARKVLSDEKCETRRIELPRFVVGEVIAMAEALVPRRIWHTAVRHVVYEADGVHVDRDGTCPEWLWRVDRIPPMYCPLWACRTYLRIVAVRREPLHRIDEAGARREGFPNRAAFAAYWDSLRPKPGQRWANNPDVTVYQFELAEATWLPN